MKEISAGSRRSPLAQAQVVEVEHELRQHHPQLSFSCTFIDTTGDKDLKTSLRTLDKTDFFTKELDALLLSGGCRIAIHSAKDLPEPLPTGIAIVAITTGVDSADVLVIQEGMTLDRLPRQPVIATSSERREEAVKRLLPTATFVDLRGTIGQRLEKLDGGEADGVVIAEAALIRLGWTEHNRIRLPGTTAELQGQLAVVAREEDAEMKSLFSSIDSRK